MHTFMAVGREIVRPTIGRTATFPDPPPSKYAFSMTLWRSSWWWIGKSSDPPSARQPQSHGKCILSWRWVGKSSDPPSAKPPHFPTHRHHSRWWVGQFPDPPPSKYVFSMTLWRSKWWWVGKSSDAPSAGPPQSHGNYFALFFHFSSLEIDVNIVRHSRKEVVNDIGKHPK